MASRKRSPKPATPTASHAPSVEPPPSRIVDSQAHDTEYLRRHAPLLRDLVSTGLPEHRTKGERIILTLSDAELVECSAELSDAALAHLGLSDVDIVQLRQAYDAGRPTARVTLLPPADDDD